MSSRFPPLTGRLFRRIALLAGILALGPAISASGAAAQAQLQQAQASAEQVSEEQLRAFARASLAIDAIVAEWNPKIEQAASEEEANALQQQANEAMVTAVAAEGLDVDSYNQIYQLMQSDPAVAETIMAYREEAAQ